MRFRILGAVELWDGDHAVAIGGPRQRAVLAALLLHRNEVVTSDRLVELVWGDDRPPTATATLRSYVSRLRRAIQEVDTPRIRRVGSGYRLDVADDELDLARFEDLTARGREALASGAPALAADCLQDALGLWRGAALSDVGDSPIAEEAERLEELRVSALETRVEADLGCGRHSSVTAELEQLVDRHPYREGFRAQLMLALYRSGRQVAALEQFDELRDLLTDRLGLDPSDRLRDLHARILRHDPALDAGDGGLGRRDTDDLPTLVLVDDHPLWHDTLRKIIERRSVGRVVAAVDDGAAALEVVGAEQPDVVVMDIDLPSLDGIAATRELMADHPGTKVLVLSASSKEDVIVDAVEAGASGYVIKTAGADEVADAIRRVHGGELVFPATVATAMRRTLQDRLRPADEGQPA